MTSEMRAGFSLLEVSIVFVIIALVVAGIFVGQAVVRNAELQSVIGEVSALKTAINAFNIKYNGLPGDAADATTFLGGGVTNGNGNGKIDYLGGNLGEEYNVWNHLSVDGELVESYTGLSTAGIPLSRLPGGMYRVSYQIGVYGINAHMISLNKMNPVYNKAHSAILTPTEAYSIDVKTDDGLASTGQVFAFNPEGVPGCVTNYESSPSATYILTNKTIRCKMYFLLDF